MSVDPIYNGPSGYVGMLNNPITTVDPDGQEPISITTAIIIGAAVSAATYTASIALSDGGFNNWDWGQFGQSVAIGAFSGAVTFGVGNSLQPVFGKALTSGQAILDGAVKGAILGSTSGFVGGALGSWASGASFGQG